MPEFQILKERLTEKTSAGTVCLLLTPEGSAFCHQGHLEVPPPPGFLLWLKVTSFLTAPRLGVQSKDIFVPLRLQMNVAALRSQEGLSL